MLLIAATITNVDQRDPVLFVGDREAVQRRELEEVEGDALASEASSPSRSPQTIEISRIPGR